MEEVDCHHIVLAEHLPVAGGHDNEAAIRYQACRFRNWMKSPKQPIDAVDARGSTAGEAGVGLHSRGRSRR